MRIERVTAEAFGPFQNETLELAPQLTVVYGPNEAGKSSWHAAIYAALCGLPKTKGKTKKRAYFEDKHRPWHDGKWVVGTLVILDNGRRIELYQDLANLARCRATEAHSGLDMSGEILNDNTPDGAKWLGLDRDSFLAVACVCQAEIRTDREQAAGLHEHLERTATAVGGKYTAAEAIDKLRAFASDNVGKNFAPAKKPLRAANVRLDNAQVALEIARQRHSQWQEVENVALEKRARADGAKRKLDELCVLAARMGADACRAKLQRAKELNAKSPDGPPPSLDGQSALSGEVAAALVLWENRPTMTAPPGRSTEEIRSEINALTEPSLDLVDETLDARLQELRRRLSDAERKSRIRPVLAGVTLLLIVMGVVLAVWLKFVAGFALVFAGLVGLVLLAFRSGDSGRAAILDKIRAIETARAEQADRARRHEALQQELTAREVAEQAARDSAARLSEVERRIIEVAKDRCGSHASSGSEAAEQLRRWQQFHTESLAKLGAEMQERAELKALLGAGTLADLESQARELERKAQELSARFDRLPEPPAGADLVAEIDRQRNIAENLEKEGTAAEAQADALAKNLPSLVEAEEESSFAEAELGRVRRLEKTLELAIEFLSRAQVRVQSDIAGRLKESLRERLADATQGRYTEAAVETADLSVRVKDSSGEWREAHRLSHGTTEQVYLLLRIALAEYLATSGEKCPLILDDVLVQCDRVRKRALLDALRVVSRDHQVILFTQEDEVLEWARVNLGPRDRLHFLTESTFSQMSLTALPQVT